MPADSQTPAQDAPRPEMDIAAILGRTPKAGRRSLAPISRLPGQRPVLQLGGLGSGAGQQHGPGGMSPAPELGALPAPGKMAQVGMQLRKVPEQDFGVIHTSTLPCGMMSKSTESSLSCLHTSRCGEGELAQVGKYWPFGGKLLPRNEPSKLAYIICPATCPLQCLL